ETCSGSAGTCPSDAVVASGTVCRAAVSGGCDIAETCTGTNNSCPADAVQPNGSACTNDNDSCTIDICNGTAASCPRTLAAACASCSSTALTRNSATSSSSISGNVAGNAIDGTPGNTGTSRWESTQGHDPEWIYVDLGANHHISSVKINWENASAKNYILQVAPSETCSGSGSGCLGTDAPWTTIFASPTHTVSNRTDEVSLSGVGRYVRMKGSTRMTSYGYSIEDFAIYGDTNTVCGTQ
ncbi:MAG TPA: discoidin domain-containing protein, partial [Polyangiaceae bacterium]|nr:discoidin domain-containing protein [Polyangiaceae bacterium]